MKVKIASFLLLGVAITVGIGLSSFKQNNDTDGKG